MCLQKQPTDELDGREMGADATVLAARFSERSARSASAATPAGGHARRSAFPECPPGSAALRPYSGGVSGTDSERASGATLSERDRRVLDFERDWTARAGDKDDAIRSQFGFSAARYYQVLGAVLASPAALAHDPMLVKRLQRIRDARAGARAARRLGRLE